MNKKAQRIVVIVVLAALLISILVPALSMLASAVTQSDVDATQDNINAIKGNLTEIAEQKKEVEAQLAAIRDDLSQAKEAVALVQNQVVLTEGQIAESQALLDEYDAQITEKENEIVELEAQEVDQYQEFCAQVRWMEETGSVSYLSILFQASSFSELLDYAMLITDIMEYSNRIINALKATQDELAQTKDELQASRDEQAEVQAQLESQKAELEARKADATALMNKIAASESEYAAEAAQLAADEAQIEKELKEAETKYAKQIAALEEQRRKEEEERRRQEEENKGGSGGSGGGSSNVSSSGWSWPLPGNYTLTSLFGGRIDPITGKPATHTGTDVAASNGTPIYAAQSGVVTTVATNTYSTYGYYVMINHGDGYVTLYAHLCKPAIVAEGTIVEKGQLIGYTGSTGRVTGPHLHYELRINGVRSDVLKLYPGMTFKYGKTTVKGG